MPMCSKCKKKALYADALENGKIIHLCEEHAREYLFQGRAAFLIKVEKLKHLSHASKEK